MLRPLCTPTTPVRESLQTWLPLSIIIDCDHHPTSGWDNVIAALEQNDRVYEVSLLDLSFLTLGDVREKMNLPFPELRYLELHADDVVLPELFDSFLGGYAPRLATIRLFGVRFPGLQNLLWSTPYLETLFLCIPDPGYISPHTMLICLSAVTRLEELLDRILFSYHWSLFQAGNGKRTSAQADTRFSPRSEAVQVHWD